MTSSNLVNTLAQRLNIGHGLAEFLERKVATQPLFHIQDIRLGFDLTLIEASNISERMLAEARYEAYSSRELFNIPYSRFNPFGNDNIKAAHWRSMLIHHQEIEDTVRTLEQEIARLSKAGEELEKEMQKRKGEFVRYLMKADEAIRQARTRTMAPPNPPRVLHRTNPFRFHPEHLPPNPDNSDQPPVEVPYVLDVSTRSSRALALALLLRAAGTPLQIIDTRETPPPYLPSTVDTPSPRPPTPGNSQNDTENSPLTVPTPRERTQDSSPEDPPTDSLSTEEENGELGYVSCASDEDIGRSTTSATNVPTAD
jgi:uncharacterized protein YdcH (DUF465 family)